MKLKIVLFFCIAALLSCKNARFNSDEWKANNDRFKQINTLIKSKVLIGKSYIEVVDLLGKEDLPKQYDSLPDDSKFSIQYLTGGGQLIDMERLLIFFDSSKVVSVEKYYN